MKRALLVLVLAAAPAFASGLADHGEDLFKREETTVKLDGYFRVRGDLLHNLDLDRGLTPSGKPLFAVPLGDPTAQDLFVTDMRLRTDVAIYAPFAAAAVKVRMDVIDDLVLGSTPVLSPGTGNAPTPAATPGQLPSSLFRLKRAYGEVLTPIGYFAAGRMGNMWGLGMYANGGDCLDCNVSDQADRVAFVTSVLGHLWAVAYDFSAVESTDLRKDGQRSYVLDPSTNVSSFTFALMNVKNQLTRDRRRKAGRWTIEYGAYLSYRWQKNDIPQSYLALQNPAALTPSSVMERGFRAGVGDAWVRLETPLVRVEVESAVVLAEVAQASLIPGVLLRDPVQSFQAGAALEVQFGHDEDFFTGGLNAGFASGDPAPGFGAFPPANSTATPGELDAPQVNVPRDTRVDNFRFNPNYRIDRILFAEIIGTVTDALYVKPWARATLLRFTSSQLRLGADATLTRALFASSTPGNDASLGAELHAALSWDSKDGFDVLAEYAVLFPFAGFDNPAQGLSAQPAQFARLRLAWRF